jgi:hypothetical protein
MMTNHKLPTMATVWELRTYDVLGNAKDGYDVNDVYSAGTVELRIPQTLNNSGLSWHVCRNADCKGNNPCGHNPPCAFGAHRLEKHAVVANVDIAGHHCPDCGAPVSLESQEFTSAAPTDRQIKRVFGTRCRITTDGDDLHITVERERDGYPIGEMYCTSHASLSPVREVVK